MKSFNFWYKKQGHVNVIDQETIMTRLLSIFIDSREMTT